MRLLTLKFKNVLFGIPKNVIFSAIQGIWLPQILSLWLTSVRWRLIWSVQIGPLLCVKLALKYRFHWIFITRLFKPCASKRKKQLERVCSEDAPINCLRLFMYMSFSYLLCTTWQKKYQSSIWPIEIASIPPLNDMYFTIKSGLGRYQIEMVCADQNEDGTNRWESGFYTNHLLLMSEKSLVSIQLHSCLWIVISG